MNATDLTAPDVIENVTFDELSIGQTARLVRAVTQEDIQAFALVSGDVNPAHVDPEYARETRFHGVIAHGMWGGALISTLLGTRFPGPGTIYIEQTLKFHRPVRVGDVLTVVLTVLSKEAERKRVQLNCEAFNQTGTLVLSGEATVLAPVSKVIRERAHMPTLHLFDPAARLKDWVAQVKDDAPPLRCAVVHPCDEAALTAALDAAELGLIQARLIGPKGRIQALADSLRRDLSGVTLDDVPHSHAAAARAVELASQQAVDLLMKGSLPADELLQAVQAAPGLKTERGLSQVLRFDIPTYDKPVLLTDVLLHRAPTLADKADIVRHALTVAQALGIRQPKVALLAASDTVTPTLPSTLDAAALCKMAERGQIAGGVLDGPLTFDDAMTADAARLRGLNSPVAGDADVLLVPDLEAGHLLGQLLTALAGAASCGVVLGARVPVALGSNHDSAASQTASLALAVLLARPAVTTGTEAALA